MSDGATFTAITKHPALSKPAKRVITNDLKLLQFVVNNPDHPKAEKYTNYLKNSYPGLTFDDNTAEG